MQVCAEPAVIVGWTVVLWLGPVDSLQALDMAAMMAQETAETLCRMGNLRRWSPPFRLSVSGAR